MKHMKLEEALKCLEEYLDQKGWPEYVDKYKLWKRASLSDDHYKRGWVILEIERHTHFGSSQYWRGLPMTAYVTYWLRYAVNSKNGDIVELSQRDGEVSIDMEEYVNEEISEIESNNTIEQIGRNNFRIFNYLTKEVRLITTLKEAKAFVLLEFKNYVDFFLLSLEISENVSKKKLLSIYKKELKKQMIDYAKKLWMRKENQQLEISLH